MRSTNCLVVDVSPPMLDKPFDIWPQGLRNTKKDSPAGIHKRQCGEEVATAQLNWEIIDRSNHARKLLTLETLHIMKLRPGINTQDEIRSRELANTYI